MQIVFQSNRKFKLWKYLVSHGQLLLRSNPESLGASRCEVIFRHVASLQLETDFEGLTIKEVSESELSATSSSVHIPERSAGAKVYLLSTLTSNGYVVAADVESK